MRPCSCRRFGAGRARAPAAPRARRGKPRLYGRAVSHDSRSPSTEHIGNLERFGQLADNIRRRRNPSSLATPRGAVHEGYVLTSGVIVATTKIERAGVGFGIGRQGGSIIVEVRPHHDTISALRGVQVGFELLNGITLEQAKKILDVLNENVIGVLVAGPADRKTEAAAG